jgi:hydroxymethylglutaryl-CoA lyase
VLPQRVLVSEVGTRDGFQMEGEFIPTTEKIDIINALLGSGIRRIEATSFVSPRAVPQLRDAAEVVRGIDRGAGARIATLVPNVRGAERAAQAGVDEMVVFVSASESHNRANVNRSIEESLVGFADVAAIARGADIALHGAIPVSFGCPFEGDVPADRVVGIIDRLLALGVGGISFGDTTGMATPPIVETLCRATQDRFPELEITLHFHNTRGIGLVNVMAGLQLGITRYESSIGGLGGCPFAPGATGNICTEDLVCMLHELGIETGIDLDALITISQRTERLLGRTLPGQVMKAGTRHKLHDLASATIAAG